MRSFLLIGFLLIVGISFSQSTGTITDSRDGKVYKTVVIGSQTWLAENINVTHFRNGDPIMKVQTREEYEKSILLGIPAWMDWGPETWVDTTTLKYKPSKLYNWHAINDPRGLGPDGFHVPSIEEWKKLDSTIGFESAKKLKSKNFWDCYLEMPAYCQQCNSTKMKSLGTLEEIYSNICDKCGNPCERIQKSGNGSDFYGFNILPDGCFTGLGDMPFVSWGNGFEAVFWSSNNSSCVEFATFDNNIIFDGRLSRRSQYDFLEEVPFYSLRLVKGDVLSKNVSDNEFNINELTIESKIKIGDQIWMNKNLDIATFKNGDPIQEAKTPDEWRKAIDNKQPAWCYYENDPKNGKIYGKLYNWFAINDSRGLAPEGWRIPKKVDLEVFHSFLGENYAPKIRSKKLWKNFYVEFNDQYCNCKSIDIMFKSCDLNWGHGSKNLYKNNCPNCKGNGIISTKKDTIYIQNKDEYGYYATPGGYRNYNGIFYGLGINGHWWLKDKSEIDSYLFRELNSDLYDVHFLANKFSIYLDGEDFLVGESIYTNGYSVRCIQMSEKDPFSRVDDIIKKEKVTQTNCKDQFGNLVDNSRFPEDFKTASGLNNFKDYLVKYHSTEVDYWGGSHKLSSEKINGCMLINLFNSGAPKGWYGLLGANVYLEWRKYVKTINKTVTEPTTEEYQAWIKKGESENTKNQITEEKYQGNWDDLIKSNQVPKDGIIITIGDEKAMMFKIENVEGTLKRSPFDDSDKDENGQITSKSLSDNINYSLEEIKEGKKPIKYYVIWRIPTINTDEHREKFPLKVKIQILFKNANSGIKVSNDDKSTTTAYLPKPSGNIILEKQLVDEVNNGNFDSNQAEFQNEDIKNNIPKDVDGNTYKTVALGGNIWSSENLNVSRFRNGDIIPQAKTHEELETMGKNGQPAWCFYNFSDSTDLQVERFGKMYNWYAVIDPRGLTPVGWHIPNNEEWEELDRGIYISYNSSSFKLSNMWIEAARMTPVIEKKWVNVEEGGYYEENWVECSNCEYWTDKQKENNPCTLCKNQRGKYIKGKYIPKKNVKTEIEFDYGWNGTNVSGFSALRVASEWWSSDVNTQHFNKPPFGYSVRSGYCYLYKDFHYKYEARFVRFVKN